MRKHAKRKRTITSGETRTTASLNTQTKEHGLVELHVPNGIIPTTPHDGMKLAFVYEYQPAGWRHVQIETWHKPKHSNDTIG